MKNLKLKGLDNFKGFSNLPNKVSAFVEYLESTGTQLINTKILMDRYNFGIDVDVAFTKSTDNILETFLGYATYYQVSYWGGIGFKNNYLHYINEWNNMTSLIPASLNKYYNIKHNISTKECFIDNVKVKNTPSSTNHININFILFGTTEDNNAEYINKNRFGFMKIKKAFIYKDFILQAKFYPALSAEPGHINEPCMYDAVSDTCFYNQGTGEFLTGRVINNPIED